MQVTPSIHALRHPFTVPIAPGIALDRFVYSYLVYGETITLIDTGVAGCRSRNLRLHPVNRPRPVGDRADRPDPFPSRSYRGGPGNPGGDGVRHRGPPGRTGMDRGRGSPEPRTAGAGVCNARRRTGAARFRTRGRRFGRDRRDPGDGDAGAPHTGPFGGVNIAVHAQRRSALLRRCDTGDGRPPGL